ncbi:hypothetical protein BU25DRAFT_415120 [Macroventuria anomochaeta]|uniref:Uncharacterized protein n=1 Tax=Macroventuria anomochaeta TaxID=301207 RepID=A0ACB6RKT8_9PLEO|nr:uncharacterized protein BU25DRAFT_415120 [Macroventuria anomochaeta]KAF2622626.1 hypothetical protein BU25DRAFT_415120 [Macroventuria anomochaeta]
MAAFSSPMRLAPPITPRRAPSPMMSPGTRRGRMLGSSEESHLRDLSPETTLRAFTEEPIPFDTTRDEYKIFACIDTLTVAERDLGTRVAKAAQRLKSWCAEIEQWGWTGSFEQPSEEYKETRRRSLEARIAEHVGNADALAPLEYYGSLLSVEVEQHEARLDDMGEELLKLDVDELKEYVLDMHPQGRSRPGSAGFGASRSSYRPMDDFSFLITQTLLSALPHHAQLKDRLNTWTARVSILRSAPRYLDDLKQSQKAMSLGWDALEPPTDTSDVAFGQWKEAVDTISSVLRGKVSDLGRRLDRMLDTLEGRDDCLPERWIDVFEALEADYGRWVHESTRRVIAFDVRRQSKQTKPGEPQIEQKEALKPDMHSGTPTTPRAPLLPIDKRVHQLSTEPQLPRPKTLEGSLRSPVAARVNSAHVPEGVTIPTPSAPMLEDAPEGVSQVASRPTNLQSEDTPAQPEPSIIVNAVSSENAGDSAHLVTSIPPRKINFETASPSTDDDYEFDEGDTVVHNEVEDVPRDAVRVVASYESLSHIPTSEDGSPTSFVHKIASKAFSHSPALISTDGTDGDAPQTPRPRRLSTSSISSSASFDSSPVGTVEESPTTRTAGNRSIRAPRPELNAAMSKRRPAKDAALPSVESAPWPPTQFSHKRPTTADDLERKISDILTTIPAHIRLTSGPGADAHEIRPSRGIGHKGSRGYLRAARSASGLKTPQLTLSPVKSEFESANAGAGRKSTNARIDNDIKLYHLTQPGKEQPIKLFIRRVGENGERVMVRVGGGWSDLGEYLRQYAEHHGRRTASEGKFEVLGLEVQNSDPASARPGSAMSTTRRFSGAGRKTPNTTPDGKLAGLGISTDSPPPPMPRFERDSTPAIAEEAPTPPSNNSQKSWHGTEVGLAGPKTRKVELTGDKLEWIEGMIKQARSVSNSNLNKAMKEDERGEGRSKSRSESRSASRSTSRAAAKRPVQDFVDLGKTGSTRRVFMRGGGGSSERLNER